MITKTKTKKLNLFNFSNADIHKQILIKMAKNGEDRPTYKTKIGKLLCNYLKRDKKFRSIIEKTRPDWLLSGSDLTKQKLIEMCKNGKKKPSIRTKLGRKFYRYAIEKRSCFDINFKKTIKSINSAWIETRGEKSLKNKQNLIKLLKNNKHKNISNCSKLRSLLYFHLRNDKNFREEVYKLNSNLSFFVRDKTKKPRTFIKKSRLEKLLKSKKPRSFFSKSEQKAIYRYTKVGGSSFDINFLKIFKKYAKDWFVNTAEKNRQILIIMAKNGEGRPAQKTKLGKALTRYTTKGCRNKKFNKTIRSLRPDWFKNK